MAQDFEIWTSHDVLDSLVHQMVVIQTEVLQYKIGGDFNCIRYYVENDKDLL